MPRKAKAALFRFQKREGTFEFDGPYEGAWVRCTLQVPLSKLFEIDRFADENAEEDERRQGLRFFVSYALLEWNLADEEGNALPVSEESLLSLPLDFGVALMNKWTEAVKGVPGPLSEALSAGGTSEEASTSEEDKSPSP